MRVGIADHFGWAIAVTTDGTEVVDRRRIELIEPGLSEAPIHYDRGESDDAAMTELIAQARTSIARMTNAAFAGLPDGIDGVALRTWPESFPTDIATQRRSPYEARADAIMYRQVIADVAATRGWAVHLYDAKAVLTMVEVPKLPPPWTKDHRVAYAAAVSSA